MSSIKFSKNQILKKDIRIVEKILKSGWLTHGKYTEFFEDRFSKYLNIKYAITVSNCTAGLHLICLALGLKKGDEVIVPGQSHTATAHAPSYTGATVKFADINLYDGTINLNSVKRLITKKTKAIIAVHLNGFLCDMENLKNLCKKNNIYLIEDCAHALGSKIKHKNAGGFGIAGSFSFYPTKQITTGEGGMIVTNSKRLEKKIRILKAFGIDKDITKRKSPGEYDVKYLGYNYRMTDFQAAIGLQQLLRYNKELAYRKKNAKIYIYYLSKIKEVKFSKYDPSSSYFIFPIFLKNYHKIKFMNELKKNNIGFSVHYAKSLERMSYYSNIYHQKLKLKNSNIYSKQNISLPVHSGINRKEIFRITNILKKVVYENEILEI